jgi:hypothetical protein
VIIFYYSGHGGIGTDGFKFQNGLSADALKQALKHTGIKKQLLLLDCCHAGAVGLAAHGRALLASVLQGEPELETSDLGRLFSPEKPPPDAARHNYQHDSVVVMSASLDSGVASGWSPLTRALEQALKNGATEPHFETWVNLYDVMSRVLPGIIETKRPRHQRAVKTKDTLNLSADQAQTFPICQR